MSSHYPVWRSCGATVAAIVLAAFVVVPIVAVAVSLVPRRYAPVRLAEVFRVDALALQRGRFDLDHVRNRWGIQIMCRIVMLNANLLAMV